MSRFFSTLFIIYFLCTSFQAYADQPATVHAYADNDELVEQLDQQIKNPFILGQLSYEADISFEREEFLYLVGLESGQHVTKADVHKAYSYLFKKRKFSSINLHMEEEAGVTHLHFVFESVWTFQKLSIRGVWIDKDLYRRQYLIEPGEPFDEQQHEHSLEKIRQGCRELGYLNCEVESRLYRDEKSKSVHVSIGVHCGKRFTVSRVNLLFQGKDDQYPEERAILQQKGEKKFLHNLQNIAYSKQKLNRRVKAFKRYLTQQGFLQAKVRLEEVIDYKQRCVDFQVLVDLGQKKEFIFAGNQFFSAPQLVDVILEFGQSAWMLPASILAQELSSAYYAQGYWDVVIDAREENDRCFFLINEGERATIAGVRFKHVAVMDQPYLAKKIFADVVRKKYFDEAVLKKALDKLIDEYVDRGYLDAKILKKKFQLVDGTSHELIITMEEGEQTTIADIAIPGFEAWLDQGPFARCRASSEPVALDAAIIDEQRVWLFQQAKLAGIMKPSVRLTMQREGTQAHVQWKVKEETALAPFGKAVVVGSTPFPFAYVLRELQFKEGQDWEQQKIKKSLLRLKALDVFDRVHIYPAPGNLIEAERPVLVQLDTDDPFELRLRGGLTAQQIAREFAFAGMTYRVGGIFLVKNPGNIGDKLGIDVDMTHGFRKMTAYYQRPWIGNAPISTLCKVYNNRYLQPGFVPSTKHIYIVTQQGLLTGLSYNRGLLAQETNIGVEWMQTEINRQDEAVPQLEDSIARAINFQSNLVDKKILYAVIEPTWFFDMLDNKLDPHTGSLTLFSAKGMFPLHKKYWDSYFVKATVEQSVFVPLGASVWAMRVRLGHIFHQDFRAIMPTERFYLGGANSMRGYQTDMAPPLGSFLNEHDHVQYAPQGGKSLINANFELRFPVYKSVGAVIFQDVGALSAGPFAQFKESTLLACSGFGVRYNTPIGPLRFDIGWKWHEDKTDMRYAWFLTFGQAF